MRGWAWQPPQTQSPDRAEQPSLPARGGSKGRLGGPAPLLLVHQWKYGEGEGEEEVEERRKNGEIVEEEEMSPPSIVFCIRH